MNVTTITTYAPAIVVPRGTTATDRKLDIVSTCDKSVLQANLGMKGKVGTAIRERFAGDGIVGIVEACANANYRPFAEHMALHLGESVVISNRASFEAFGDVLLSKLNTIKASKGGGYREAKDGTLAPTTKHANIVALGEFTLRVYEAVRELHAERLARRLADREAERQQLANEQAVEQPAAA